MNVGIDNARPKIFWPSSRSYNIGKRTFYKKQKQNKTLTTIAAVHACVSEWFTHC